LSKKGNSGEQAKHEMLLFHNVQTALLLKHAIMLTEEQPMPIPGRGQFSDATLSVGGRVSASQVAPPAVSLQEAILSEFGLDPDLVSKFLHSKFKANPNDPVEQVSPTRWAVEIEGLGIIESHVLAVFSSWSVCHFVLFCFHTHFLVISNV